MKEKKNREKSIYWTKKFFPQPRKRLIAGKMYLKDSIEIEVQRTCPKWMYFVVDALRKMNKNASLSVTGQDVIVAVSACSPDDVYDEEIGLDIVSEKLDGRYHTKMATQYWKLCNLLEEVADRLGRLAAMHEDKARHIENDLYEYYIADRGNER